MLFIEYPKCSTCKKAKLWLEQNNISFESRDIILNNPKKEELNIWIEKFSIPISKLFNTNGIKYRELNLKDKLLKMTIEEKIELLSSDGMLVKRPILISNDLILIGFKKKEWANSLK